MPTPHPHPFRYLSLFVFALCIRLDMRGKGVQLPDWLQFRLHTFFVPRHEAQLAKIHDWIERAEAKELQLLQRLGFRDKKWTIPGGNFGDWALVLDSRYM